MKTALTDRAEQELKSQFLLTPTERVMFHAQSADAQQRALLELEQYRERRWHRIGKAILVAVLFVAFVYLTR